MGGTPKKVWEKVWGGTSERQQDVREAINP
jgi:hypothetical protein